jgi:hypothetical protein
VHKIITAGSSRKQYDPLILISQHTSSVTTYLSSLKVLPMLKR